MEVGPTSAIGSNRQPQRLGLLWVLPCGFSPSTTGIVQIGAHVFKHASARRGRARTPALDERGCRMMSNSCAECCDLPLRPRGSYFSCACQAKRCIRQHGAIDIDGTNGPWILTSLQGLRFLNLYLNVVLNRCDDGIDRHADLLATVSICRGSGRRRMPPAASRLESPTPALGHGTLDALDVIFVRFLWSWSRLLERHVVHLEIQQHFWRRCKPHSPQSCDVLCALKESLDMESMCPHKAQQAFSVPTR